MVPGVLVTEGLWPGGDWLARPQWTGQDSGVPDRAPGQGGTGT